ncbi:hypothetical protein [Streptomyces sp. NPDC048332]|uniref:hypothetical protein n=1 Tax=unclassified Streptomyces TaxID=2593676 RepID=UPI003414ED12
MVRHVQYVARRTRLGHLTVLQHGDAVGEGRRVQVVHDQDRGGDGAGPGQLREQAEERAPGEA